MNSVLIIEQSTIIRECLAAIVRGLGHRAVQLPDPSDAVKVVGTHNIGTIVADITFGGTCDLEWLRELRAGEAGEHVPVFVISDVTEKQRIMECVQLGITQYLLKAHFAVPVFEKKLTLCLRQARAQAEAGASEKAEPEAEPKPPASASGAAQAGGEPAPASGHAGASPEEGASAPSGTAGLRDLKPLVTRSALRERIEEVAELKALSPTVGQVMRLTRSSEASLDSIVDAVRVDQAISLKVIKLANSGAFARGKPVRSVRDGVLRIGMENIRQAVTNIGIMDQFSSERVREMLDHNLFWEHSLAVALIASQLAHETRVCKPDEAFTMGLLHDVGQMLLVEAIGDQYAEILRTAERCGVPVEHAERRLLLMDHGEVCRDVLGQWGMPSALIEPIVNHHQSMGSIRRLSPKHVETSALLGIADRLAEAMGYHPGDGGTLYPTEEFCESIRLPEAMVERVRESVPEQVMDLRLAFLNEAQLGRTGTGSVPLEHPFHPIYVGADPVRDAGAIACAALAEASGLEEHPTMGVVRVRDQRGMHRLWTELREREQASGVGPLPTLLLTERERIVPPEEEAAHRTIRRVLLPAPMRVLRQEIERVSGGAAHAPAAAA